MPNHPRHHDTRSQLLDAAQQFIQRDSYDGFSFRHLAQEVGIQKASIYHHFETKEALAVAMLERVHGGLSAWSDAHARMPPMARLKAYCQDLYLGQLGAGEQLCPAGAFVSGWSHLPLAIRAAARKAMDRQVVFLMEAIQDGVSDGSIRLQPGRSVAETAMWFGASIQGALAVSRAFAGAETFSSLSTQTLAALGATD